MPVILSCFLAVFVLKENVYAAGWAEVLNGFETGIVDIEITEYQEIDGNEILWEDDQEIIPGKVISKIPRIRNNGCECYIWDEQSVDKSRGRIFLLSGTFEKRYGSGII